MSILNSCNFNLNGYLNFKSILREKFYYTCLFKQGKKIKLIHLKIPHIIDTKKNV